MFSVGALYEKGVKLDLLLPNRAVLRDSNDAFPVSTKVPGMCVLHTLVDGQKEPQHTSLTTVDTDTWHPRISPCPPRALEQLAEELTAEENNIDRSGAGTSSEIGYTW